MAQPKKKRPALTPDQIAAAKQAGEDALARVLGESTNEILMNVTFDELIEPSDESDAVKGTANDPGGWVHAPAYLELFAAADRSLTKVGNLDHIPGKKMARVRARIVPGTKLLIIKAAGPKDLSALQVNRWRNNSSAWINLFTLLPDAGLTVQTGWRERYDIAYVPEKSPLYPALVMDLGRPLERRAEPVPKKKKTKAQLEKEKQDKLNAKGKQDQQDKHLDGKAGQPDQPNEDAQIMTPAEPQVVAESQAQQPSTESK